MRSTSVSFRFSFLASFITLCGVFDGGTKCENPPVDITSTLKEKVPPPPPAVVTGTVVETSSVEITLSACFFERALLYRSLSS